MNHRWDQPQANSSTASGGCQIYINMLHTHYNSSIHSSTDAKQRHKSTNDMLDALSSGSLPLAPPATVLFSALLGLFLVVFHQWPRAPKVPTINAYSGDWMLKKAHKRFEQDARALIREGTERVSPKNA